MSQADMLSLISYLFIWLMTDFDNKKKLIIHL